MGPWIHIGNLAIPSFLLVQSLSAVLLLSWASVRAPQLGLPPRKALDLTVIILISGLIGGRLLHVLWEAPAYYWSNPFAIFHLLSGGYVYFGGLIAALLASSLFLKLTHETQIGPWFDFAAPLASLGTALGRIGCFLAGCCYGKVCFLPWAMPFVDERGLSFLRHPTQLYSFLWEMGVLAILLGIERITPQRRPGFLRASGSLFLMWLILHSLGRFMIEFVRDDFRGPAFYFSISQWLSLCALILSCLVLRRISVHPTGTPSNPSK